MAKKSGDGIILIAIAAIAYFLLGGRGAGAGGTGGGGGNGSLDGGDGYGFDSFNSDTTEIASAIAASELQTGNFTTTDYGQVFTLGGGVHL